MHSILSVSLQIRSVKFLTRMPHIFAAHSSKISPKCSAMVIYFAAKTPLDELVSAWHCPKVGTLRASIQPRYLQSRASSQSTWAPPRPWNSITIQSSSVVKLSTLRHTLDSWQFITVQLYSCYAGFGMANRGVLASMSFLWSFKLLMF